MQVIPTDIPWAQIVSGGAGVLVITVVIIFLRHLTEARKEGHDTVRDITKEFSTTIRDTSHQFAETATGLLRESRESQERREAALHEVLKDITRKP